MPTGRFVALRTIAFVRGKTCFRVANYGNFSRQSLRPSVLWSSENNGHARSPSKTASNLQAESGLLAHTSTSSSKNTPCKYLSVDRFRDGWTKKRLATSSWGRQTACRSLSVARETNNAYVQSWHAMCNLVGYQYRNGDVQNHIFQ